MRLIPPAALLLLLNGLLCTVLSGCRYDTESDLYGDVVPCDSSLVSYTNDLVPLLEMYCFECHTGPTPSGDRDFSTYEDLAGVAETNVLLDRISRDENDPEVMPSTGPMTSCEVDRFRSWIEAGYPNN